MTDSQEKSDDLIAELAKLMASNAQGSEEGQKPTVIKLPPLSEATVKTPPVRIPGMEPPAGVQATGSAPTPAASPTAAAPATPGPIPAVRIPGLEKPAGVSESSSAPEPAKAPETPGAGTAAAGPRFDFGKAPSAPVIATEPLANWQAHVAPKTQDSPAAPASHAPAGDAKAEPLAEGGTSSHFSPEPRGHAMAATPASSTTNSAPKAQSEPAAAGSEGIAFDFGFGSGGSGREAPTPADDPIADLIAAELGAAETAPAQPDTPAPSLRTSPIAASVAPQPTTIKPAAPEPAQPVSAVAIPPASAAPRPSDADKFIVAPVFGLGSKPAQPASSATPAAPAAAPAAPSSRPGDPLDEIEDLIGEAMRAELGGTPEKKPQASAPGPQAAPQPAPVVPPLSTNFGPRRAGLKDNEPKVQSAEDAILAAAAASGAEIGRVDAPASEDRPYKRMKVKPPRTSGLSSGARQYVGIAVAGTLLLAAGFGLYWVLGMNRDDPATAPVLTADASPAKVEPVAPPATTAEPSGSVVFNEINGGAPAGEVEALVSRDETAGVSPVEVARTVTPDEATETGLANRKVRTVTVRPDGTIVSGDDAVAGTEALPVDRPNVPEIPGAEMAPSDLLTAAVAETQAVASSGATPAEERDPIAALVANTGEATATPAEDAAPLEVAAVNPDSTVPAVFDGSLVAPIPMPRPSTRNALVGGSERSVGAEQTASVSANAPASTPLVAVTQPAASAPVSSGSGAYVQLSSQPSEAEAQRSLRALQSRMAGMLNGASLEIRQAEVPGRGTWYRVALPVSSFQEATQTCAAIKANGGDCVAING